MSNKINRDNFASSGNKRTFSWDLLYFTFSTVSTKAHLLDCSIYQQISFLLSARWGKIRKKTRFFKNWYFQKKSSKLKTIFYHSKLHYFWKFLLHCAWPSTNIVLFHWSLEFYLSLRKIYVFLKKISNFQFIEYLPLRYFKPKCHNGHYP